MGEGTTLNENNRYSGLVINNPFLKVFNYLLLILIVIIIIAPILILGIIAFKSNEEYTFSGIWQLPKSFLYFDNFKDVINNGHLLLGFKNIGILIVTSVIGSIIMGTMASYVLSRFDFKFRKLVLSAYLVAMLIPGTTTVIATFNVIKALHAFNTIYAGILLYLSAGVIDLYVFMQFIQKIPKELDESAMIDGSSYFRVYRSIILPQMKPAIATITILKVLGVYNDYFVPLTFMTKSKLITVSVGLYRFAEDRNQRWNVLAAGILLVLVPTIIIYMLTQKYIISGATEGSVKS
jgi:raffinose/stachyose/melibiose transport system permease protein